MGFPPVPCSGILMELVTPVSAITNEAVEFPIAEGVKVIYIWQLWSPEIVPTQANPSKAKLALLVPVMVMLLTLTEVVLGLLTKTITGEEAEFAGTVPN
jgi:hypothetical protein